MKWFWNRGPSPATRALKKAERDLDEARARTPHYESIGRRHREIQRVNHLGQNAAAALRGETK